MSTHQLEINTFGQNWLGKYHDIYKSNSGKFFNTVTEDPPLPCFNCGEMHWRKNCPRGMYHSSPRQKNIVKFKGSKIFYDEE
jgi:hypothetical protein